MWIVSKTAPCSRLAAVQKPSEWIELHTPAMNLINQVDFTCWVSSQCHTLATNYQDCPGLFTPFSLYLNSVKPLLSFFPVVLRVSLFPIFHVYCSYLTMSFSSFEICFNSFILINMTFYVMQPDMMLLLCCRITHLYHIQPPVLSFVCLLSDRSRVLLVTSIQTVKYLGFLFHGPSTGLCLVGYRGRFPSTTAETVASSPEGWSL